MKKILFIFIGVLLCLLVFLFIFFKTDNLDYEAGLPDEHSAGMTNFIGKYLISDYYYIVRDEEEEYILSEKVSTGEAKSLTYHRVQKEQVQSYYEPMFDMADTTRILYLLLEDDPTKEAWYEEIEDPLAEYLPRIEHEDAASLLVETEVASRSVDLHEYEERLSAEDELTYTLYRANEHGFIVSISNEAGLENYFLLATADLKDIDVYKLTAIEQAVANGELAPYYDVFDQIGDEGKYIDIPGYDTFVNREEDRVVSLDEEDKLSYDQKYVYIGADKEMVEDGTQTIQPLDDYLAGDDTEAITFNLKHKKIAKEAGIKRLGGIGTSKVIYFDEHIIMLYIAYDGFITGTAGGTNAIIDLDAGAENPTVHVVDLDYFHELNRR